MIEEKRGRITGVIFLSIFNKWNLKHKERVGICWEHGQFSSVLMRQGRVYVYTKAEDG